MSGTNDDLDAWLQSDVAADVAKATGIPNLATPMPGPQPPADKSLQKTFGIGRGGVIRNPNTKKVTVTGNTVTNPKPSKIAMTKSATAPTPEEELAAEHPALAIPSIMTGMDMDTAKTKNGAPPAEPHSVDAPNVVKPIQTGQPMPVTYESTLRELLMLAYNSGGVLHFGTGEFVLSIQLTAQGPRSPG